MKHTKEPWRTFGYNSIASNDTLLLRAYHYSVPKETRQANAERIVAAVNFVAGYTNEQLKEMGSLEGIIDEIHRAYESQCGVSLRAGGE